MSFVRDHYEAYDAPRLVVRLLTDTARHAVPAPAGTGARQPVGGVLPGGARGRRAVRGHPGRRDGRGADGGAAHPTDRDHAPRQPARAGDRREPVARRAAGPEQRPVAAGGAAGGVGPRHVGFVAHIPHYLAQLDYPNAAAALLEQVELAGRLTIDLDRAARAGRRARDRDRALPLVQRGGRRGGGRRWSSSTTPSSAPRRRAPACSPPTSRCRPARRSASSSSSSSPASDDDRLERAGLRCRTDAVRPGRAARPGEDRRRPLPRRSSRRRPGRSCTAGRSPRRRWWPASRTVDRRVRRALAALLLPAARRLLGADHLRRRAPARRPLVPHPPGHARAARAADLRPDDELPEARGPASTTRTRCPTYRSPEDSPPVAPAAPSTTSTPTSGTSPRSVRIDDPGGRPGAPGTAAGLAAGVLGAARRPVLAHGARSPTLSDMTPDRRVALGARPDFDLGRGVPGLARPHGLVPPAVPRRRVVALRPALAGRVRRPRAGAGANVFSRSGELVASVAQEAVMRKVRS